MAADEGLQKVGKLPVFNVKEDEWSEWFFVMKSHVSLLSALVPALLADAEARNQPDMGMASRNHAH